MDDVVRVWVYIGGPDMDQATLETVHAVRREFFDRVHYPASTLVAVDDLVEGSALIEIDADAVVPTDEWETESG